MRTLRGWHSIPLDTHLYSANETADGSVSAYSIDRANGQLTLLNTVSSQGAGPAHLSVHPSGKYVLVANYAGGTVAVLPILSHGELGPATDVKHDQGPVGPAHAAGARPEASPSADTTACMRT
jgi:6-phosphogluconolactonase